ncbi:MAG: hypothetical protein A4E66_01226 [Syntrophus sp. PtaB.Bin001]|nr:MAG: hypothetical protein A4E66_01226 [Syntrophus sp. PtaB.Bin001]
MIFGQGVTFKGVRSKAGGVKPKNTRETPAALYLRLYRLLHTCAPSEKNLFSQTKALDYLSVSLNIFIFQIIKKSSSLTDQFQQSSTGMMVFFMDLEMISQIFNPCTQKRYLDFGRSSIFLMQLIISNNILSLIRT